MAHIGLQRWCERLRSSAWRVKSAVCGVRLSHRCVMRRNKGLAFKTTISEFDYVIVGGGAAGCFLAAQLASESDGTVALLERGSADANAVVSDSNAFFNDRPNPVLQGPILGAG